MNIENRIKQIRESKRIKQIEVAEALNMDNSQYAKIEKRGSKLSLEQIEAIANALKVSVAELIGIDVSNTVDNSDEMGKLLKENEELKERLNKYERIFREPKNIYFCFALYGGMSEIFKNLLEEKKVIEKSIEEQSLEFDEDDLEYKNKEISKEFKDMFILENRFKEEGQGDINSENFIENSIFNTLVNDDNFLDVTIGNKYKHLFKREYYTFIVEFEKKIKNKTLEI